MSTRLFYLNIIILIMLNYSIQFLKIHEPVSSRRGLLINILKNCEKQAKNDERIDFLVNCRKAKVTPKCIQNCLQASIRTLGNCRGMKNIHEDFQRKTLNELVRSSHRKKAYLLREHARLINEARLLSGFKWTEKQCFLIYQEVRTSTHKKLVKKFNSLINETNAVSYGCTSPRRGSTDSSRSDRHQEIALEENTTDPAENCSVFDPDDKWYDAPLHVDECVSGGLRPGAGACITKLGHGGTSARDTIDCNELLAGGVHGHVHDSARDKETCTLRARGTAADCDGDVWYDASDVRCERGESAAQEEAGCYEDHWYDAIGDTKYTTLGGALCEERWFDALQYLGQVNPQTKSSKLMEETDHAKKFLNLTGKPLHPSLETLLEKGPNFALSRKINTGIMKEVEIGLERGAFSIHRKEEIEAKNKKPTACQC